MARFRLGSSACLALVAPILLFSDVTAFTPLVDKRFSYPDGIPYRVDTDNLARGTQTGYNRCNSTTEGPSSLCQTAFVNSLDDFCLWAPISPNSIVGNVEGEMVAWCTKPGRGTRIIPAGALRGVQFMKTPDYVQVVGFVDQTQINIQLGDSGGEMDPHGADLRGNPLGGLVYSNAYTGSFKQVIEWHNFMGSDLFCFKACDPAGPNAARFCEHIYDRIGCAYNAPNNARSGVFESCQGDSQDFPGVYVENGVTQTYRQPPESLGPITTIPYTARIPASSNCVQLASESLYSAGATTSLSLSTSTATSSGSTSGTTSGSASTASSASTSTSTASVTSGQTSQSSTGSGEPSTISPSNSAPTAGTQSSTGTAPPAEQSGNAAGTVGVSGVATIFGVVSAVLFFA